MTIESSDINWLDQAYEETMDLLYEAKNYNKYSFSKQVRHLDPRSRMDATTESMRVTTRLSHTVAWILNEKAVWNDEISRDAANELHPPLTEEMTCLNDSNHTREEFPFHLRDLLDRSLNIFNRAARIETMLRSTDQRQARLRHQGHGLRLVSHHDPVAVENRI